VSPSAPTRCSTGSPKHERKDVIDAIEADKIGRLKGQAKPLAPPRLHPVRAVRSAKTRHNPDRLFDVAGQVRSDLRHLNRVGRRSGLLAGQVGKGSRTRAEAQLSARASTPSAVRPVRQKLARAQQERVAAVKKRAQAKTPAQKRAAAQEVAGATDRVQNLRRQLQGTQARRRSAVQAQRRVKAISERRFSSEVRDAERAHAEARAAHAQLRQESPTAARLQASRKHVVATKRALADARARTPVTHDEAKGFFPRTNAADVAAGRLPATDGGRAREARGHSARRAARGQQAARGHRRAPRVPQAARRARAGDGEGAGRRRCALLRRARDPQPLRHVGRARERRAQSEHQARAVRAEAPAQSEHGPARRAQGRGQGRLPRRRGVLEKVDDDVAARASARQGAQGRRRRPVRDPR
jgi:hypothetical protein